MFDLTKENDIGPTQQHIPAVSSAAASSCLHSASLGGPHYGTPLLLLCRRWMSDAVVTSRRGRVRYQENLPLSHSWTGYGMVRFATRSVEGRLPENLAAVLAPLLRYDCHSKTTHDRNSSSSTIVDKNEHVPLIHVRADALMQDDALVMGSTLPVQVTVYIASPQTFFELMAPVEDDEPSGSASQYFASTKSSTSNNNSLLRQQQGLRHSKNMPLADAAYLLLQWAEYGDVPDFKIPPPPPPPPTGVVDSSSSVEVSTPPPTKAGPKIVKSEKGSKGKNDDETEHFCDGDVDSLLELNEDEYEAESVDGSTDQGKELDGAVQVDNNHAKIPEADDPIGFADHVTLRPYQKQALYFMIERETVGDNREQLEAQLQLLNKLSSAEQKLWSSSSMSSNAFSGKGSKHGIVCDCGPVLVSEASKKQSITLDGKIDPVNHPLWKRRFLALPDMTSCISFYVNELVGVATHKAPEPPRPCSGGILADAMGLGKTVMLMALILQSKVERAVAAKPVNDDANQCVQSPTTTLVVAKMSLLAQWEEEIRSKTNLTYKIYYGQSGKAMSVDDLNDVVSIFINNADCMAQLSLTVRLFSFGVSELDRTLSLQPMELLKESFVESIPFCYNVTGSA